MSHSELPGIVHFGPGAFHRAHQADYVDRLLEHDPRWGIAAVSLRSRHTVDGLARQKGRYTLAILDSEPSFRTISAHRDWLGPGDEDSIRRRLADPSTRIVTSTVTEKGYCLDGAGSLDFGHPDIIHDLGSPNDPVSIVGWLALGLADRRSAGIAAFTPICCDNLASNGRKLGAAVVDFASRLDPDLGRWIEGEVRFPGSMVNSITPATDAALHSAVRAATGRDDLIPVAREAYSAWVVEDILPDDSPDLASVGVTIAGDVAAFEQAKLRILNGAHSSLAYLGLLLGHSTVADAMADPVLASFIERLVRDDITPGLRPSPIDLDHYATEILQRFRNPAIGHKLAQIAWDGSQKLPYRLLDTLADALGDGRTLDRLALPLAAWMLFVERQARSGIAIVDPLGAELSRIGQGPDLLGDLLSLREIFPAQLAENPSVRASIREALSALRTLGTRSALESGIAAYA